MQFVEFSNREKEVAVISPLKHQLFECQITSYFPLKADPFWKVTGFYRTTNRALFRSCLLIEMAKHDKDHS